MKRYPNTPEKMLRLAAVVGKSPEEIFPPPMMDRDWLTGAREWTIHRECSDELLPCVEEPALLAPETAVDSFALREAANSAICNLRPREEKVIRMRMGIGCPAVTLDEIATELCVSRCRIGQIEREALNKLSRDTGLQDFADFT